MLHKIFLASATGTVVYEQHGDELRILAHAGFDGYDILFHGRCQVICRDADPA